MHEAGQVTYLLKKQENIRPENGYKFRNGNDLFLLSACNTQRFSHANQTASERKNYGPNLNAREPVLQSVSLYNKGSQPLDVGDTKYSSFTRLMEI